MKEKFLVADEIKSLTKEEKLEEWRKMSYAQMKYLRDEDMLKPREIAALFGITNTEVYKKTSELKRAIDACAKFDVCRGKYKTLEEAIEKTIEYDAWYSRLTREERAKVAAEEMSRIMNSVIN